MNDNEKLCSDAYKNYLKQLGRDGYTSTEPCEGIRNYWDGDEVFYYPDKIMRVDYKYIKGYVAIELVQVTSKYDSWLYNKNIDKIVYFDGQRVYEFDRQDLCNLAYFLTLNFNMTKTSYVYKEEYHDEAYQWALSKLNENKDDTYFRIPNFIKIINSISPNGVHMNIAHNSHSSFSAINIRIPVGIL